ncbi:MAG: hypothetical protein HQL99_07165 [Magnetococcales bacterium]|nr:hypothetical protein [Magnetococcales bacterium]
MPEAARTRLWILALIFWGACQELEAREQSLAPSVNTQTITPGTSVSVTIQYATANPAQTQTTGLGVWLHYDSSRLTFDGFTQLLHSEERLGADRRFALIGRETTPVEDAEDRDGDRSTDQKVGVAWASLDGQWPGVDHAWPVTLFTARFRVAEGVSGRTMVRLSASGLANGYTLTAGRAVLHTTDAAFAVLDVDQSGAVDASDGVLILRRLNGASTVDTGVVLGEGQTNASVIAIIDAAGSSLDVDKDKGVHASDGVLILRRLNAGSTIDTGVLLPDGQSNATVISTIDALK